MPIRLFRSSAGWVNPVLGGVGLLAFGMSLAMAEGLGDGHVRRLATPSKKALALKASANSYYHKKNYAEACRIYGEIAALDTFDLAIRIDLGLCLQKLGTKDSALQVSREVLRISGRSLRGQDSLDWSDSDLRFRKSAYFNLDELGGPMREPDSGKCETWANLSICAKAFYVCADVGWIHSGKDLEQWRILRVGLTQDRSVFSILEAETAADLPRPEIRDMEEVNIEHEFENKLKWLNRDSSVTVPLGETKAGLKSECRVLYFNPCEGVVGMACALQSGQAGQDQIVIGEYYLIPTR